MTCNSNEQPIFAAMSLHVAYAPVYVHAVPENHRFPMEKYHLLHRQLLFEGTVTEEQFFQPEKLDLTYALAVHTPEYLDKLLRLQCTPREQRVSGFTHSQELIDRELTIMEGTRLCAEKVLKGGIALNIAGGTHHAYTDRGEGFCLLNDQAIAAKWLLNKGLAKRILIIDLDVHQGNGTAEIFQNEQAVFTFSMHGASNYPLKKETSDCDIEVPDGSGDALYLELLTAKLHEIMEDFQPGFLFYQCGVDVLESDALGKLNLSIQGCRERDRIVLETAKKYELPIVCSMGGGYSKDIRVILEAHANTFRLANYFFG